MIPQAHLDPAEIPPPSPPPAAWLPPSLERSGASPAPPAGWQIVGSAPEDPELGPGGDLAFRVEDLPDPEPDPECRLIEREFSTQCEAALLRVLTTLSPREQHIIRGLYLAPETRTLTEMAVEIGISRSRVGQIEQAALSRLRRGLRRQPPWIDPQGPGASRSLRGPGRYRFVRLPPPAPAPRPPRRGPGLIQEPVLPPSASASPWRGHHPRTLEVWRWLPRRPTASRRTTA